MNNKAITQNLFGIAVTVIGIGFLLDALDVFDFTNVLADWWPTLLISAGLLSLLSKPSILIWPFVISGAGVLLLLGNLGVFDINVWNVIWPAILIATGLSLIFDRYKPNRRTSTDGAVDLFAALSGYEGSNTSKNFNGGKITALMGGINLDLREAKIKDKAVLDTFVVMGGIELRVPETWNVATNGLPILGGWEDKSVKPKDKNAPTLFISGTCIMGGIEIRN